MALDTAECEGSNDNFQDETARNPSISKSSLLGIAVFALEATDTKGGSDYTGESDLEPSASQPLGDSTTHGHSDMDKMVVDRCRPKLATELLAHVLTTLDKVDKQVRTKPSVTVELSIVVCTG